MNQLKIISDGTINGTKVIDMMTGQTLPNIKKMTLVFDVNDVFPSVNIEFELNPILDVTASFERKVKND